MCKWNHKVSFTHSRHEWCNLTNFYLAFFLLMSLLENATSPWGQSWERVLHKHSCIHHSTCAFGTRAVICMHLCLCKTLSQDCPHGEIRHSHIAIVVRPPGRKTLCRSLVICKGFFRPATPAVIWRVFQFCKEIWFGLWSCYLRMAFLDGDNFCKAFAGALVNMSYHSWLRHSWYDKFTCAPAKALQKLSPSRKTTLLLKISWL